MNNREYSDDELMHHTRRAQSTLYHGPGYSSVGHYPSVQKVTVSEIPFKDSESALRFMRSVGRKDPNAKALVNKKHMAFISRGDEDEN